MLRFGTRLQDGSRRQSPHGGPVSRLGIILGPCVGQVFGNGPMGLAIGIFWGALSDFAVFKLSR
jgi:hypothetical protein